MQKTLLHFTALALVISPLTLGTAQAQQNCNFPKGSFDQVYCDAKVMIRADDELNATYQKLLKKLSPSAQQVLRQTQRAWMTERDTECVEYDPNKGDVIYSDCAVQKTTQRLNFLNDRLRECLSSGCQPSKLR